MTATLPATSRRVLAGDPLDLTGRLHAFLPEPVPNRAEALEGVDPVAWLDSVVSSDRSGFTVLAGSGATFVLVYADGVPVAASLTGSGQSLAGRHAVDALAADAATPRFALTYPCESIVAAALTALFGEPAARQPLDADPRAVAAWLAGARGERASGALFVDAGDDAWSILLLGDGAVVAGYGSDDRSLKPGIDDVTVLLHRERLWATRLAPAICDLSSAFTEPASPVTDDAVGDDLLALEAALIAALARLEHALTTATDSESAARAQRVADAFATVFADLVTLPAIAATVAMLPEDAGLSERIDLFQECIAHAVAPLAASDDSSARYLKDAANELVHQARAAVRR